MLCISIKNLNAVGREKLSWDFLTVWIIAHALSHGNMVNGGLLTKGVGIVRCDQGKIG